MVAALIACGQSGDAGGNVVGRARSEPLADSLVLTNAGVEVWFTLAREATGSDGQPCIERGLELRNGSSRIKVPLLYTGSSPVILNDSTVRAVLWTHCQPGDAYLVNLRSGQPVRERKASPS